MASSFGVEITGLDHVQLAMPAGQERRALWFYGELLGLSSIPKPEPLAGRGGCWFRAGPVQVHLGVMEPFTPSLKAHPALLVLDLEAAYEALVEADIKVQRDDSLVTAARFYAWDPFGNRLEFIQQGQGFTKSHSG